MREAKPSSWAASLQVSVAVGVVSVVVMVVSRLVFHNPDYWGENSGYGKALTEQRFGRMVTQSSKVTSQRPGGRGPRGYMKSQFTGVWHRLGIGRVETGASGETGATGAEAHPDMHQMHRPNQMHRSDSDAPGPGAQPAAPTPLVARRQELKGRRTIRVTMPPFPSSCSSCGRRA